MKRKFFQSPKRKRGTSNKIGSHKVSLARIGLCSSFFALLQSDLVPLVPPGAVAGRLGKYNNYRLSTGIMRGNLP